MTFDVYYADGSDIKNYHELCQQDWANHLIYYDIDSFAIDEDGYLMLVDDCNNIAYCPKGMFKIVYHFDGQNFEQLY